MLIERVWAMPNHRTFQIKPIKKLINQERVHGVTIEPFPFQSKIDCLEFLAKFPNESADFGLIDPPYSKGQVLEHYKDSCITVKGWHSSPQWASKVKREVARVIKLGGKTIIFGWNTSGIGKKNGFEITRILLVCHGAEHYDTLCVVEQKVIQSLDNFTFSSQEEKTK